MEIPRSKSELWEIVHSLRIESYVQHKFAKTVKDEDGNSKDITGRLELVRAIQRHFIEQRYGSWENMPKHLRMMLEYPPQLACRRNQIKDDLWQHAWASTDFIVEEKLNGLRFLIIYFEDEGLHVYSRHIDANEMLPIEYIDKFVHTLRINELPFSSFMIDSELRCTNPYISTVLENRGVVTETELQAVSSLLQLNTEDSRRIQIEQDAVLVPHTFDCISYEERNLCPYPFWQRRQLLKAIVPILQDCGMRIVCHPSYRLSSSKKYQMYERMLEMGGEGMIAKRFDAPYEPSFTPGQRSKNWIKFKRSANQILGDTITGWISGFKPGDPNKEYANYVGSVEVSSNVLSDSGEMSVKTIAWIPQFSMHDREAMTCYNEDGHPILNPDYYGKILEVDGMCFSPRSKHLVHARFVEWRFDKDKDDCVIDQSDIDSQIDVG